MSTLDLKALGFKKKPSETRVVVAMSGGVDSSVAAALLVEAGFDVVGLTMQLYDHGMALQKKGACCAGQDIYDAAQVAEKLGFSHYVLDYESIFKNAVMEEFADGYLRGETPIPCIRCNERVKFQDLLKMAKDLKGEALVTGHYVRRVMGVNGPELHTAFDPKKDQSYFLFSTTKEQLDYLRFPLGGFDKSQTRKHAARFGLDVSEKPDSQDICFVPDGDYARVVEALRPEAKNPGMIVHLDGTILGAHEGIINYTIGQRKGIGIGGRKGGEGDPLYVIKLDPQKSEVVVGPRSALGCNAFYVQELNWIGGELSQEQKTKGVLCEIKIRSSRPPVKAHIFLDQEKKEARVILNEAEQGVSPGQAAVFYDDTRVLGGGWIRRSH